LENAMAIDDSAKALIDCKKITDVNEALKGEEGNEFY
jgi:hypothetical protein